MLTTLGSSKGQDVGWSQRVNICLGVARGLHYLHALAFPKIIHRDISARNILLDHNLEPKIANFEQALLYPEHGNVLEDVRENLLLDDVFVPSK